MSIPQFATQKELFSYLKANKSELTEMKKSVIKKTDGIPFFSLRADANKADTNQSTDTEDVINRDIVGNTYLWLDSHDDVHIPGLFAKSISERPGKIWHLHDHEFAISAKVGQPQSVVEKYVDWRVLGVEKDGQTQILVMNSNIMKAMNQSIFMEYKTNQIDQHSVSMQYVRLALALNDPESETEYKVWNSFIDQLGNKDRAEKQGYFWAVYEAKLREISCVLEGSNSLTPVLNISTQMQPEKSTAEAPQPFDLSKAISEVKFF